MEKNSEGSVLFTPQTKFIKEVREFKIPDAYSKVIDLFIFRDPAGS